MRTQTAVNYIVPFSRMYIIAVCTYVYIGTFSSVYPGLSMLHIREIWRVVRHRSGSALAPQCRAIDYRRSQLTQFLSRRLGQLPALARQQDRRGLGVSLHARNHHGSAQLRYGFLYWETSGRYVQLLLQWLYHILLLECWKAKSPNLIWASPGFYFLFPFYRANL